jgi:hypothetical protein
MFDFVRSKNFKLLNQIKGNSTNNAEYFKFRNFCQRLPLFLLAPGVKQATYSTAQSFSSFPDLRGIFIAVFNAACHLTVF